MKEDEVFRILLDLGCSHTEAVMRIAEEHVTKDNYNREIAIRDVLLEMD